MAHSPFWNSSRDMSDMMAIDGGGLDGVLNGGSVGVWFFKREWRGGVTKTKTVLTGVGGRNDPPTPQEKGKKEKQENLILIQCR